MLAWWKTTLLLCSYGFLKEFRPSEPYLTRYLTSADKNFTKEEVNQEIYPVGTYAHLALLVVVFLVTDLLRCKPVISIQGIAGICTYAIVIAGTSKTVFQVGQLFYGLFVASDIAYFTYMYLVSDERKYQRVSSYTRIGILLGRFLSGIVSQAAVSFELGSLRDLNYLTITGIGLAFVISLCLPLPPRSLYFNREPKGAEEAVGEPLCDVDTNANGDENPNRVHLRKPNLVAPLIAFQRDLVVLYSNSHVLLWSAWWALATCGYLQVSSYIQILWEETLGERNQNETLYSGAVDAFYTVVGSGMLWLVGRQRLNLASYSSLILAVCSIVDGVLVLTCALSLNMWIHYTFYISFKVVYHSMMVLASSEVAKGAPGERRALVFGFNTFIALILQTVLTIVVASRQGLALPIRTQFLVYGGYFVAMGLLFSSSIAFRLVAKARSSHMPTGSCAPNVEDVAL